MNKAQKLQALIVDDEPNILLSLEYLLRKNKFGVFVARDGREAIEIINTEKPDLVILDIMMPEVDGYEVCTMIKSTDALMDIKVVFLSAKTKPEDIEKGLALGADLYLTKPFSTRELMVKINALLDR